MRSGELFAGVAGLGMAVSEVFGAEPAWFAEFDAAPSKALAHHFPGIPNLGDVTKADFRAVPHTHVRCGGFPCQDVSVAGRRAGMRDGTRSGLWSEFRRSIQEDRPDWVVIENVRGLLSADAAGDVEPCPWCLGDGGEQHALRALGAVLGDLADLRFDAEWTVLRASDIGAPHGRFRVFILAWPREHTAADTTGRGRDRRTRDQVRGEVGGAAASRGGGEPRLTLLPTPAVAQNDGESVESWTARRERVKATGVNGNGMGMPLPIAVQLLPTPEAKLAGAGPDYARMSRDGSGGDDLTTTIWKNGLHHTTDWGPYTAAIRRWEDVVGRPAPAPVRYDGKGGKPRLNPELTEWMMGWPAGWVTDPAIGMSRAEQLKACGNGVVTLQAVAALRELLARPGVPAVVIEAAA